MLSKRRYGDTVTHILSHGALNISLHSNNQHLTFYIPTIYSQCSARQKILPVYHIKETTRSIIYIW